MTLPKMGNFTTDFTALPTVVSGQAEQMKAKFNARGEDLKTALNLLADALMVTTDGVSGADNIGMTAITETGTAATVQAVIEALITRLKAVADATSGADLVGMTPIAETGVNATVQSIVEALITRLKAVADGASGADLIGATAIEGLTGTTTQALLEAIKAYVDMHKADTMYLVAGGTATAITLTIATLTDGYSKTFIASADNGGAATTINGKSLYKPNTTTAPTLIAGKAYTVWYDATDDCFFIKASAEGNTIAAHVLAGDTFSNDNDTGLTGTLALTGTAGVDCVLSGRTFYNTNPLAKYTGTILSKSAQTYTPGTTNQVINAGRYLSGAQTILGDADLIPANILNTANIFGVAGSAVPRLVASGTKVVAAARTQYTVSGLAFTPTLVIIFMPWYDAQAVVGIGSLGDFQPTYTWRYWNGNSSTDSLLTISGTSFSFYTNSSFYDSASYNHKWVALA